MKVTDRFEKGDYLAVTIDLDRRIFSIHGPVGTDERVMKQAIAANAGLSEKSWERSVQAGPLLVASKIREISATFAA